jgi:hypothetical protein
MKSRRNRNSDDAMAIQVLRLPPNALVTHKDIKRARWILSESQRKSSKTQQSLRVDNLRHAAQLHRRLDQQLDAALSRE